MDKIIFKSITHGKCKVLCVMGGLSIIELEDNVKKYVVAIGLDVYNGTWILGSYFKTLEEAYIRFKKDIEYPIYSNFC